MSFQARNYHLPPRRLIVLLPWLGTRKLLAKVTRRSAPVPGRSYVRTHEGFGKFQRPSGPEAMARTLPAAPEDAAPDTHLQSQRDCVFQPRVARDELPWDTPRNSISNPERVVASLGLCAEIKTQITQPFRG